MRVVVLLLFFGACNCAAQSSANSVRLHTYVKSALEKIGIVVPPNAAIVVRFDEGSSCTACYAHESVADSVLISGLQRNGANVLLVRFVVVRRMRDFEAARTTVLDTRAIVLPDVGAEGAKACRTATKGALRAIVHANGRITTVQGN